MNKQLQWCNWSFDECIKSSSEWLVTRDCDGEINLKRGDTKEWKAYKASLQPQIQTRYPQPRPGAQCPKCHREVNGVNPYDDGQTWRIINE